jgi:hypothetical protein
LKYLYKYNKNNINMGFKKDLLHVFGRVSASLIWVIVERFILEMIG